TWRAWCARRASRQALAGEGAISMKAIFSPAIALLMHQRNFVKMTLAGVVFTVPLLIVLLMRPTTWTSAAAIASIVTYVFACYYLIAMYLTSDESWAVLQRVAARLADHDLREDETALRDASQAERLGTGQFGKVYAALTETFLSLRELVIQAKHSSE